MIVKEQKDSLDSTMIVLSNPVFHNILGAHNDNTELYIIFK